jgi:hypothetical protein
MTTAEQSGASWYLDDLTEKDQARVRATRQVLAELEELRARAAIGEFNEEEWQYTDPALVAGMVKLGERHGAAKIARIAVYLAGREASDTTQAEEA